MDSHAVWLTATDMWYNLPSKRERQAVLREYNPTNYSVVNMRTIDSVSHPS